MPKYSGRDRFFFSQVAKHTYSQSLIISDSHIFNLYGNEVERTLEKHIPYKTLLLLQGEQNKNLESMHACWQAMAAQGLDRHSLVIGLGGGVITDLAGFAAGTFMRGIDVLHIPTTLMGMVDAAIGGKTGINLPEGKNLLGVLHHPKMVLVIPSYLKTLPEREFRSGLAEVIKYGIIWDPVFFEFLESNIEKIKGRDAECLNNVIARCCEIKAEIVQKDAQDISLRNILNWGHTFAHAIESATQYSLYLHGEAVAIGMSCAAHASCALGYATENFIQKVETLCHLFDLDTALPEIPLNRLIAHMVRDKKAVSGKIHLILAKELGKVFKINHVDEAVLMDALQRKIDADRSGSARRPFRHSLSRID